MSFALFIEVIEIPHMQPLAPKLDCQPPHAGVAEHALRLVLQRGVLVQFAGSRETCQFFIGHG